MTGPDPGLEPAVAPLPAAADGPQAEATQAQSAAEAPDPLQLRTELAQAQARAQESHELYLRARADAENGRRRAQEELAKAHKFAIESFAEALVPVADSLEKTLAAEADLATLRAGVELTLRQLQSAFERNRLTEINPAGERFDPHRHQAIAAVPPPADGSVAPNHVVSVLQKGWAIAERVLRPALVTVAQGGAT